MGIPTAFPDVPVSSGFHMSLFTSTLNVGALVEPLTSQMAEYLGVQGGLMVKQVARKSEAASLGPQSLRRHPQGRLRFHRYCSRLGSRSPLQRGQARAGHHHARQETANSHPPGRLQASRRRHGPGRPRSEGFHRCPRVAARFTSENQIRIHRAPRYHSAPFVSRAVGCRNPLGSNRDPNEAQAGAPARNGRDGEFVR